MFCLDNWMIVVRTSESWPEFRIVGEFSRSIELSYLESIKNIWYKRYEHANPPCTSTHYWRTYLLHTSTRIRETEERDMSHTTAESCGWELQQYQ